MCPWVVAVLGLLLCSCVSEAPEAGMLFPDEWEQHEGTIMIFPAARSYPEAYAALQRESADLANAIQQREQVTMFVHTPDETRARRLLDEHVDVVVGDRYRIDWARDNSPMIVVSDNAERRAVCFRFNGWGKKYRGWRRDVGVSDAIATELGLETIRSELVLEGGAIEIGSTPSGMVGIVTAQCVVNPNRTSWTRGRVEAELRQKLGLAEIIWLEKGLNPDPITDGHVDGLLKFVRPNTVLLHTTDDVEDENYRTCEEARCRLEKAGIVVVELPLADDIVHMNFYIGSGGSVAYVPVCGDPEQDEPALAVIAQFFEHLVPIRAVEMGRAGGGVHCYTMQIPALRRR